MESIPRNKANILVVDDDVGLLASIRATLLSAGMPEPALVSDGRRAVELVREHDFMLVLLDLIMPHISGIEVLQQLKEEFPHIECVIVTAVDDVSHAVQAMKFGAYDYLVKPLGSEKLILVVSRALERYSLRRELALFEGKQSFSDLKNPQAFKDLIAEDDKMAVVFHQTEAVAVSDYSVILSGESGTGKEMLARIIHDLSNRSSGQFMAINMAAFSEALFEAEFFGRTKGAYTGASTEKKGFFETAHGGTIFLDEITELELPLQAKLLRVIQERELYRLGSTEAQKVDVRILAATNREITEEVREGRFRSDLFHRLNMCHIRVPPLRERKKDILPLARHFLKKYSSMNQKQIVSLAPDLAECLRDYPFPGNVRELENVIAAAVLFEEGKVLTVSSVRDLIPVARPFKAQKSKPPTLAEVENEYIAQVMDMTNGNRTKAAKILGIGLRTLQRKLKAVTKVPATSK